MFINHLNGYSIEFSHHAYKELQHMEQQTHEQIMYKLSLLTHGSSDVNYKKLAGQEGLHRLRVGFYRLIFTVDDENQTLKVIEVARRDHVYDAIH